MIPARLPRSAAGLALSLLIGLSGAKDRGGVAGGTPIESGSFGAGEAMGDFPDSTKKGPDWSEPPRRDSAKAGSKAAKAKAGSAKGAVGDSARAGSEAGRDSGNVGIRPERIDSARADAAGAARAQGDSLADARLRPDSGATGREAGEPDPGEGVSGGNAASIETFAEESPANQSAAPTLVILPMTVGAGTRRDAGDLEKVETALRLGLAQSGRFRVWTAEEAARAAGKDSLPRNCFSERCLAAVGRRLSSEVVVASQYTAKDSVSVLKLVLAGVPETAILRAVQVRGRPDGAGLIPFSQEAALRLAVPDRGGNDAWNSIHSAWTGKREGPGIDESLSASGKWRDIPWLNPKDTVDNRLRWGWAGSGVLLAGVGLAWAQGQLLQEDGNAMSPSRDMLSGSGSKSFLRGFFAAPTLGARYAAMGGAGIAHVDDGLALLMNPAGVARSDRENVVAAKRNLPDGSPSLFLAYSGPLYHGWMQGLGMQFEGDGLANETTLHGALACDLGRLGKDWTGIKAGAQVKVYLAQVGESGNGLERSTGRSVGLGMDLGVQARLNDKITAALTVRDAAGFLRHSNTYTDQSYTEVLPPEYRLGASYQAAGSLLLLLDGQKGVYADQVDHIRLGGEQVLFDFLALRCGLHEIFGREAVRKMSVGFGLDTDGLKDKSLKLKFALNYGYEFGLNEDEPLGAGQQFSIDASF